MTRDAVLLACGFLVGVWAGASLCSRRWMRTHGNTAYTRRECKGGPCDGLVVVHRAGHVWVLTHDGGYEIADELGALTFTPGLCVRVGS
jgi:hypothetical protein